MAKSARATSVKLNKQRLKRHVFGPVELARTKRLSAKLLELAALPIPQHDIEMEVVSSGAHSEPSLESTHFAGAKKAEEDPTMDVDPVQKPASKKTGKKKIEKRKSKKSSIVFATRRPSTRKKR